MDRAAPARCLLDAWYLSVLYAPPLHVCKVGHRKRPFVTRLGVWVLTKASSACTLPCTLPLFRLLLAAAAALPLPPPLAPAAESPLGGLPAWLEGPSMPEARLSRSLAAVMALTAACRACADPAFSSSCCDTILRM